MRGEPAYFVWKSYWVSTGARVLKEENSQKEDEASEATYNSNPKEWLGSFVRLICVCG
jgi:hypothetical protein